MSDFNFQKAVFWLVAFVIGAHVAIAFVAASFCLFVVSYIPLENIPTRWKCDADNRIFDLLGTALSTALAFATGRWSAGSNIINGGPKP